MATTLILISALLHALWNALIKKGGMPRHDLISMFFFSLVFTVSWHFVSGAESFPHHEAIQWAILAGLFEAGYFVTLAKSMLVAPMGYLYLICRGGAMVLVWSISLLFLQEKLTMIQALAAFMVLIGMMLAGVSRKDLQSSKKALWPILCALCITGHHLSYARALFWQASPSALFSLSVSIGWVGLMLANRALIGQTLLRTRERPLMPIILGLVCSLSFVLFLKGLAISPLGHSMTLRNTSIAFAQVLALIIGERPSKTQWLGACLVSLGAIFL